MCTVAGAMASACHFAEAEHTARSIPRSTLRKGYRIIRYLGHGSFDERSDGALLMSDRRGDRAMVSASTIVRELRGSDGRVVVLNACETAMEGTARSFIGLAPALVRDGLPAVLAMQFKIRDSAAIIFSRALYNALADELPLDAAVTEGRKAISAQQTPDKIDWGLPVLFMRSPNGVIWHTENKKKQDQGLGMSGEQRKKGTRSIHEQNHSYVPGKSAGNDIYEIGGGVSGTGIAIGRSASAVVGARTEDEDFVRLFAVIYDQIDGRARDPDQVKLVTRQQVEAIEEEAAKGDAADAAKLEGWLTVIRSLAPDILEITTRTLLNPVADVAKAVKKVARGFRVGAG